MAAEKPKSSSISTLKREYIMEEQVLKEARQEGSMPSLIDEIVKDLTQPNISIFGVYGSNALRKASLVAQINMRVEREGLFDAVVMASVTDKPDLKSIQVELGNELGLQLNEITTPKGRATGLCDKIKTLEKILIILDNLVGEISLGDMGIPFENNHMGCKILLVASSQELLSHKMKTQKEYCVDIEAGEVYNLEKNYSYRDLPLATVILPKIVPEPSRYPKGEDYEVRQELEEEYTEKAYVADFYGCEVLSEAMKSKLNEMISALTQPNMSIVGMYGSSNTRKRQVVKQIKRRVVRDGLFDVVVKATVVIKNTRWFCSRKSADVGRIQGELAKQLHLQLDHKTSLEDRATLLCDTIKTKDKILIILDNLQGRIDLGQIEIPFGNDHMGSKIVLIAHTSEILSNQMNPPLRLFSVDG